VSATRTPAPANRANARGAAFRAAFRARIEAPVAAIFVRTHLTPNMLTLIGFGIAVIGAYLAAIQAWIPAGLVVGFGAAFDLFDGALARATGKTSKFGAFMDSTFDRAGEAVVYIGVVVGLLRLNDANGAALAAASMAAAFMVSYTRAKSESLGFSSGSGLANVGLAPREVRSVILVIGLVGAALNYQILIGALALITILATVTAVQRILFVYRQSQTPS
jgi:CDP-diacylglycerol--glycerol-3-phosphate 3-phosphatidyltransferase